MGRGLCLVSFFFLLMACGSSQESSFKKTWHGSMQGLASSLNEVMPGLIAKPVSDSDQEKKKLKQVIKDLESYSDNLDVDQLAIPSHDPSLRYVARDFQKSLQQIKSGMRNKPIDQTRHDLKQLSRYCIACHTRIQAGSSFYSAEFGGDIEDFSHFEKATFFSAIRQFEKALVHYEQAITDRAWRQRHQKQWEEAVMNLLAITIRVKDNANLTTEMLSRLNETGGYPPSMEKLRIAWKQSSKEWEKEKKSDLGLLKVVELLQKAEKLDSKLQYSGLVNNLRASRILNHYLQTGEAHKSQEQAILYYSGMIGTRLSHLNFGGFPQSYFMACRDLGPKTEMGVKCQKRL